MALYFTVVLIPGLALVWYAWWAAKRARYGSIVAFCGVLFLFGLLAVSIAALLQAILTFLLVMFWSAGARPRVVLGTAVVALLVSLTLGIYQGLAPYFANWALQNDYPVRSVAARLAYEADQTTQLAANQEWSPRVERHLQMLEERVAKENHLRAHFLQILHERTLADFIAAPGFGYSRTSYMMNFQIRRSEPNESIPQPVPEYVPDPGLPSPTPTAVAAPQESHQENLYWESLDNFLNGARLGYAKNVNHTIGFEAHRFTNQFDVSQGVGDPPWRLTRLELVSLLKHERPAVYVSESLPNMDELRSVPTRPPSGFEAAALERLRRDENLVTEDLGNRIDMLGAIRASETCLNCHSVKRGDLLGAFSYELVPVDSRPGSMPEKPSAF